MSIPTCNEIGTALERAVRAIAIIAVAFYVAGEVCGRAMYRLSDWLVNLTHRPVDTLLGLIPTKPKPEPILQLLGARVLSDEELEEFELLDTLGVLLCVFLLNSLFICEVTKIDISL